MKRDTEGVDEVMESRAPIPLGENTSIRLGLLIAILAVALGGAGTSLWWAATMTAKLDNLTQIVLGTTRDNKDLQKELGDLRSRIQTVESQGSPALAPRVSLCEQEISRLREDFAVHKVLPNNSKP